MSRYVLDSRKNSYFECSCPSFPHFHCYFYLLWCALFPASHRDPSIPKSFMIKLSLMLCVPKNCACVNHIILPIKIMADISIECTHYLFVSKWRDVPHFCYLFVPNKEPLLFVCYYRSIDCLCSLISIASPYWYICHAPSLTLEWTFVL